MYGGNLLPSPNTIDMIVTCTFWSCNVYITADFYPDITDSTVWWHIKVHPHFIGISYLAQAVAVHFLKCNHMLLKGYKLLFEVCQQFLAKFFFERRTCSSISHLHTKLRWPYLMTCDVVWFGKFTCFIFYWLTYTWHYSCFFFTCTNSTINCSNSWKCPCLCPLKDFQVSSHLSANAFVAPTIIMLLNTEHFRCTAIIHFLRVVYQD